MKACAIVKPGETEFTEIKEPTVGDGDVLVSALNARGAVVFDARGRDRAVRRLRRVVRVDRSRNVTPRRRCYRL